MTEKNSFLNRYISHIRIVQDNAILLESNLDKLPFKIKEYDLIKRALKHDNDKLSHKFVKEFYNIHIKKINGEIINTREYTCCNIHYETNRHHCEYHEKNNVPFSNLDICEMCCDMLARQEQNGDIEKYSQYCEEIFFKEHKNMLKYKNIMYFIFDLLIELKKK